MFCKPANVQFNKVSCSCAFLFGPKFSSYFRVLLLRLLCSCPAGSHPSNPLRYQSKLPGWRSCRYRPGSHRGGLLQRAAGVGAHLPATAGWAVPQQPLRGSIQPSTDAGVCDRSLRYGHRQHLRAGGAAPLQHHWVGQKHPVLPRAPSLRAGQPWKSKYHKRCILKWHLKVKFKLWFISYLLFEQLTGFSYELFKD